MAESRRHELMISLARYSGRRGGGRRPFRITNVSRSSKSTLTRTLSQAPGGEPRAIFALPPVGYHRRPRKDDAKRRQAACNLPQPPVYRHDLRVCLSAPAGFGCGHQARVCGSGWWARLTVVTMVVCEMDLRVGGRYRYVRRNGDGKEMGMGGGIQGDLVLPDRIVATEEFDEPVYLARRWARCCSPRKTARPYSPIR